MARMRQAREVIWERQAEERRRDLSVREVELQTLASFIAGSAGNQAGVKAAQQIRLLPPEDTQGSPRAVRYVPYETAQRWFGG